MTLAANIVVLFAVKCHYIPYRKYGFGNVSIVTDSSK